jgi:acetolactate synthase I/II/III large subunit
VDIPLDLQSKQIDWSQLRGFETTKEAKPTSFDAILPSLNAAKRPVMVVGNGVRLAGAEKSLLELAEHWQMPILSSWAAADIVPSDHPRYIGRFGIFGDRASNFTVQNSDLLIVLGSRLSIPQTGYRLETFARGAKIIWVDVDEAEMLKFPHAHRCVANVGDFIAWALSRNARSWPDWTGRCDDWKYHYPVVAYEAREGGEDNSFLFIERLSRELPSDAVVVTDMGTAFTCTFQSAKMKAGQRWLTASGHAPMGYALPGAIGAHYATGKRVTCLVGDGSLMFNLQELQTIGERKLPIDIYVLSNGGYLTIKHTQSNHFGRFVGSEFSFPAFYKFADAFGVALHEIVMDPMQPLIPRSSSMKLPDGSITSRPIEDLYPFLPREELRENMIVPTVEVFQ